MNPSGKLWAAVFAAILLTTSLPALAESDDLETCNPPEFTFAWLGFDQVKVTAKADPEQSFIMTLAYLEEPREGWDKAPDAFRPIRLLPAYATGPEPECANFKPSGNGLSEGKTYCMQATPDGSTASFNIDRAALLQAGGFMSLKFKALEKDSDACSKRLQGPEDPSFKVLDKHTLSFDIGSVFNLQGNGGWETNAEAAVLSTSQWRDWFQSGFSFRYSAIGAVDEEDPGDGEEPAKAEGDGEDNTFNPFESGGGVVETNVYILVSPIRRLPRLGLVGGWGLSTVPGEEGSELETRERRFVGLRNIIQAYNSGRNEDSLQNSSGYIQAGWATDELWRKVELEPGVLSDESARYFFEGQLELPKIGTDWFRIDLRFFASVPRSGDGPSDIRVSALGSIDPRRWFPGIGGDSGNK